MKRMLVVAAMLVAASAVGQQQPELERMSLEQLMDVHVVSASNVAEKLSEAPATVIVVSADDIRRRGYRDLSQILDDLPGIDVVRPFGATYFKAYWRGYRNTIGDPFLVMIDGVVFNHLYFNTADILVTFPIADVDRVEVVYGPASSVYGASAFMGVVNVITRTEDNATLGAGSDSMRIADGSWSMVRGKTTLRVTARVDDGDLDQHATGGYEYTKSRYFDDPLLWGGFARSSSSPHRNRAFDVRLFSGNLEAALQYFRLDAGYGNEYAGDRSQNHAVWSRPETSAYLRYANEWTKSIHGSTMFRYRRSDVAPNSDFAQSFPGTPQTVGFSFWRADNSSWTASHDVDVRASERLSLRAGFRWERKDLEKAYIVTYGPLLPPSQINDGYPNPPQPASDPSQRLHRTDGGVYLQSWYRLSDEHRFNFGVRDDHDSRYGGARTVRVGYVGNRGPWTMKALFGQAFQEPNNRLLYGGWDGSGSDPTLRPERSTTEEVSAQYTTASFTHGLSVYRTRNRDTFINTVHSAENLGRREVIGFDYDGRVLLPHGSSAWLTYSRFAHTEEDRRDALGNDIGAGPIGDLAPNKLHAGITGTMGKLTGTLRARYIGQRDTVDTNPVSHIGGYATADALARIDFAHVGLSVSIDNLANRTYFEPGVRDANAGTTPGFFDAAGVWHGSNGYFNSLLPQAGRTFFVALHWR